MDRELSARQIKTKLEENEESTAKLSTLYTHTSQSDLAYCNVEEHLLPHG